MIELTYTEARYILDVLEEVSKNPNAHEDSSDELEESINMIESCMADYWARKHGV